MKKSPNIANLIFTFCSIVALSSVPAYSSSEEGLTPKEALSRTRGIISNMIQDNDAFTKKHRNECFEPFLKAQHPRATVVACSDSRVHTYALDESPDNDLFMIRNIGNQISTAEGSVEYGIHHLNTSLLLILGHTGCGAIKAALGNTSELSPAIKRELATIKLSEKNLSSISDEIWLGGVKENINAQVAFAKKKFAHEIEEGTLTVVGAIYDLHNAFHHRHGRLIITNVNGSTSPAVISKTQPLQGLNPTLLK